MHARIVVALCGSLVAGPLLAAACVGHSGPQVLPLVELYTSEGCSSCPPAERWLSAALPPGAAAPGAAVLAFHVDYWDDIGWPDRYARHSYTERQQRVAAAQHATFTYTPQVVVQGRSVTQWAGGAVPADLARLRTQPAPAAITVSVQPAAGGYAVEASADVRDAAQRAGQALYIALTDSGHDVDVRAGENRGVRLHHDHVVRALSAGAAVGRDGQAHASTRFAIPDGAGSAPTVVAFVQDIADGRVLQALALPVAACGNTR